MAITVGVGVGTPKLRTCVFSIAFILFEKPKLGTWRKKKLLESRVNDPFEECSATTFAQLVAKEYSESKLMT
jgi:hypothetical protein